MKILLLPDSFKGSLSAFEAADILEKAARAVFPQAEIISYPMADGGEGTMDAIQKAAGGTLLPAQINGPCGQRLQTQYLSLGQTAVIELAKAAGFSQRLPGFSTSTMTTFGVGELIDTALRVGHRHIVLALGGSCTTDAGCGMAAALGTQFFDTSGRRFIPTGRGLSAIKNICLNSYFFQPGAPKIEALCDVSNPLFGSQGAACVFGPQKGATPDEVKLLDEGLKHLADLFKKRGARLNTLMGGGAAGGTGAGVAAFLHGRLISGVDAMLNILKFEEIVKDVDLIVTGEGCLDEQTAAGKVAAGIAHRAQGKPVVVLTGSVKADPKALEKLHELGVTAVFSILREPGTLSDAVRNAADNLHATATNVFRLWQAKNSSKS